MATTPDEFLNEMKKAVDFSASEFFEEFKRISSTAGEINKTFGQTRQRINELKTSLADATPGVIRLGGELSDVADTITGIAEASRRNVVANTKDIEQMYAASKVLGTQARYLAEEFTEVGIGISEIPGEIEKSVNYIQSIGGNTKQVMDDVRNNISEMNRYQFEGGVQGLTKMAAQASMLKFDMGETFKLADGLFKPERAVEVASAFQRLGLAVGSLGDPFALMSQSINDPQGLQDSLVNVAKQFTYFDEKTKTFKINPQGVLTLREMEEQTGVSAKEMTKLGLAAAEADKRISEIGAAGLTIKEEDKQYVANIASMGKGGKYEVQLEDGTRKELGQLNQKEFDKLIQQQKDGPKTLEEIARKQMNYTDTITSDVRAIKAAVVGGVVTQENILKASENMRKESTNLTGAISKNFSNPEAVRKEFTQALTDLKKIDEDVKGKGGKKMTDALSDYLTRSGEQLNRINSKLYDSFDKALKEASDKSKSGGGESKISNLLQEGYDRLRNELKEYNKNSNTPENQVKWAQSLVTSKTEPIKSSTDLKKTGGVVVNSKQTITHDGNINLNLNINTTGESSKKFDNSQVEQIGQIVSNTLRSTEVLQKLYNNSNPGSPTKVPKSA